MRYAILYFVTAAILSACAVPNPPSLTDSWELSLEVTGGLAGVQRQLSISNTGELIARDQASGAVVEVQVPAADLVALTSLLTQLPSPDMVVPETMAPCNDCFEYTLRVSMGGLQTDLVTNDVSLENSSYAPLISKLTDLLQKALAGEFGN